MGMETKKEKENKLVYHSPYVGDREVNLEIGMYQNNGRIYIGLTSMSDGCEEPFSNVTVNIDAPAPDYCGYLDTNNLSNVEKFVKNHKLGEFTGIMGRSGYCEYPLYMFNADRLRALCPEQMALYEQSIGAVKECGKAACR